MTMNMHGPLSMSAIQFEEKYINYAFFFGAGSRSKVEASRKASDPSGFCVRLFTCASAATRHNVFCLATLKHIHNERLAVTTLPSIDSGRVSSTSTSENNIESHFQDLSWCS